MTSSRLIEIENLRVDIPAGASKAHIVKGVDFHVSRGEILGVIGESGSGKTITGLALLRLLPEAAIVTADTARFDGVDILQMSGDKFDALRGVNMAMIFQDPVASFNPAKTIAWHFHAIYRRAAAARQQQCPADWSEQARQTLRDVGIARADDIMAVYAHQVSGGMLQRVLIALVLALSPDFIIADEPTTNLDKLVERQVLHLFRDLQERLHAGMMFITHDMAVAASLCTRIMVMYGGQIVECGAAQDVLNNPKHPYTQGLVATSVALSAGRDERLPELPGAPPNPSVVPSGCLFFDRCPQAMSVCQTTMPSTTVTGPGHDVRCLLYEDVKEAVHA